MYSEQVWRTKKFSAFGPLHEGIEKFSRTAYITKEHKRSQTTVLPGKVVLSYNLHNLYTQHILKSSCLI